MLDFNNTYNFPVELQPVFDQHGTRIDGSNCVMRTDTNQVLGVHGSRYHIVSHDDVVNSVLDGMKEANDNADKESADAAPTQRVASGETIDVQAKEKSGSSSQ